MIRLDYSEFKSAVFDQGIKFIELSMVGHVRLYAQSGNLIFWTSVADGSPDETDYEANYQSLKWTELNQPIDSEVGATVTVNKLAPDGWHQQLYEYEIRTASTFFEEKDFDGNNQGFITHEFFAGGVSQGATPDATTDTTIIRWMPDYDYYIMTGGVKVRDVLTTDVRLNVRALERSPAQAGLDVYNFTQGNLNLRYHQQELIGLQSNNGRLLPYTVHPQLGQLYTNELSFKFTHPAGEQHDIAVILNIFVEPGK